MEIHLQKCQHCGSRSLRNILVRDEAQKVLVQCRDCERLVARYVLNSGGYFHAGKGFESFLRSIERDGGLTSPRDVDELFHDVEAEAEREFNTSLEVLKQRYDDDLP